MTAEVTKRGILDMQVCVPEDWKDSQVVDFAEQENPCGTTNGWFIRRQGSKFLGGSDERVPCEDKTRPNNIHIMLDA